MVMSATSKSSRKKLDRPFDAAIWAKAQDIAVQYQIVVRLEDGHYFGRGVEMPTVMGDGKTADQCVKNTHEALVLAVAYMLEKDEVPPAPAMEGKRDQQVNIRLSAEERLSIEAAARRAGFTGIADFVRAAALAKV